MAAHRDGVLLTSTDVFNGAGSIAGELVQSLCVRPWRLARLASPIAKREHQVAAKAPAPADRRWRVVLAGMSDSAVHPMAASLSRPVTSTACAWVRSDGVIITMWPFTCLRQRACSITTATGRRDARTTA
jgi:hypothetical protein